MYGGGENKRRLAGIRFRMGLLIFVLLQLRDSEALRHFVVKKASAGNVRLHPFAIDDKLRDGALAGALENLLGCARSGLHVDLFIGNVVLGQEALGLAAIRAPCGRVNGKIHNEIALSGDALVASPNYLKC